MGSQRLERTGELRPRQQVHINIEDQIRTHKDLLTKSGSFKAHSKGLVQVDLIFRIRVFQGKRKPLDLLKGELVYSVMFELEKRLAGPAIEHLFKVVAPLAAWPYVRQHLHHSLPEMGLPPILLPIRQAR